MGHPAKGASDFPLRTCKPTCQPTCQPRLARRFTHPAGVHGHASESKLWPPRRVWKRPGADLWLLRHDTVYAEVTENGIPIPFIAPKAPGASARAHAATAPQVRPAPWGAERASCRRELRQKFRPSHGLAHVVASMDAGPSLIAKRRTIYEGDMHEHDAQSFRLETSCTIRRLGRSCVVPSAGQVLWYVCTSWLRWQLESEAMPGGLRACRVSLDQQAPPCKNK